MSLRTPLTVRVSDPSAFAGTRTEADLEVSPQRNPLNRIHYSHDDRRTPSAPDLRHTVEIADALCSSEVRRGNQNVSTSAAWLDVSPMRRAPPHHSNVTYDTFEVSPQRGDGTRGSHHQASARSRRLHISRLYTEFNDFKDLGNGNFGSVMRGCHDLDGCEYAIKKVSKPIQGEADLQHRLQEVYALSGCSCKGSSPYILKYHDAWIEDDGYVCIRTEFLSGGNLRSLCVSGKRNREANSAGRTHDDLSFLNPHHPPTSTLVSSFSHPFIDPCSAFEFLFQMGMALCSIHSNNRMAHLDVKPDNIFVSVSSHTYAQSLECSTAQSPTATTSSSQTPVSMREYLSVSYKLGDFGLARPATLGNDEQYKGLNDDEGDKRYLCPYLLNGRLPLCLKEADVYSLGASALEVLGCKSVSEAHGEEEIIEWVLQALSPSLCQSSPASKAQCHSLSSLVARMLRRNPLDRPSTFEIAETAYRGMQFYRLQRGTHAAVDEPLEIMAIDALRKEIEEVEQQLREGQSNFEEGSQEEEEEEE